MEKINPNLQQPTTAVGTLTIKWIAIASLLLGLLILTIYCFLLFFNGYLNFTHSFSLDIAAKAAPFVGSCVGIFFTLAGTLLVFENLRMTRLINERNQLLTQKNQFENIFFNLLTQQRQIKDAIKNTIYFSPDEIPPDEVGVNFFDNLAMRITIDFEKRNKTREELIKLYNKWFNIYNSDLGHFFRHLYYIVKFVDQNPYFSLIKGDKDYFQKEDYINIMRAQLSNGELILLALNGLTLQGEKFKKFIDNFQLLKNINLEEDLDIEYYSSVPDAKIIIEAYPHIKSPV